MRGTEASALIGEFHLVRQVCVAFRLQTDQGSEVGDWGVRKVSAMASEFESGVDCRAEMVGVGVAETGTQVVAEPTVDLVGSPKPVAAPGVGDGGREASWTSFTVDEKPHALTCSTGPSCNVGHGDEPGAGKTGDPNSFDGLKLRDRSKDGLFEGIGVAVEVGVLDPVRSADQSVVAACFKDSVDEYVALEVWALDDEGERVGSHVIPRFRAGHGHSGRALGGVPWRGCPGFGEWIRSRSGTPNGWPRRIERHPTGDLMRLLQHSS